MSDGTGSYAGAILDAETGEPVGRVANDRETQAFVVQAEWTDSDEVLMTVNQGESGRVMRLTPTGTFDAVRGGEYANADPYRADLHLETRP